MIVFTTFVLSVCSCVAAGARGLFMLGSGNHILVSDGKSQRAVIKIYVATEDVSPKAFIHSSDRTLTVPVDLMPL